MIEYILGTAGKKISTGISAVLIMFQLFLGPAAQISYAQELPVKIQKPLVLSRLHIITPARSTLLVEDGKQEALLISDNLSSTRIIEKIDGTSAISQRYFPYGQTQDTENTITDKQFTGHRNLSEAGVYHAGARFYNPQLATFIQADKVEGPNRYAYVGGNPISNTDPTGNLTCTYCKDLPGVQDDTEGRFPDQPAPIAGAGSFLKANMANLFTSVGIMRFLPRSSLDNYVTNNDVNVGYMLATSPAAGMVSYKGWTLKNWRPMKVSPITGEVLEKTLESVVREAQALFANSPVVRIAQQGAQEVSRGRQTLATYNRFMQAIEASGVKTVWDTPGRFGENGQLYTTIKNPIRTVDRGRQGKFFIMHPQLRQGVETGNRGALNMIYTHGLHDFAALQLGTHTQGHPHFSLSSGYNYLDLQFQKSIGNDGFVQGFNFSQARYAEFGR